MGKLRVLTITTALHHKHRFRLHNFLPYLSRYLDLDILELPQLGYDMGIDESLFKFLLRVINDPKLKIKKLDYLNNINVYVIRSLFPGDFGALSSIPFINIIIRKILNKKYDAILATPFPAGFIGLIMNRYLEGIPVIYEDVDRFYDFFHNPMKRLLVKFIEYKSILDADTVIAVSPQLYIEDINLRNDISTYYIPNGVEYKKFRMIARRIKKRNKFAIVYVGAVEWWSGLDIAVNSMKYVAKEVPNAKLFIIGDFRTSYGFYLYKLIKNLNLYKNIIFLGRRSYDFVIRFLASSRVGIITFPRSPVTVKAFPYKVLEYCAAGMPTVMTNVTALAPMIKKYNAGSVHDLSDVEGIASSIVDLILNDRLWEEKSNNAIYLASIFDIEKLAKLESKIIYLSIS